MAQAYFTKAVAITPSDVTVFAPPLKAVYIGGTGNLTVQTEDGTNITFTAPPVGSTVYIQAKQVRAATTATLLIGLWD